MQSKFGGSVQDGLRPGRQQIIYYRQIVDEYVARLEDVVRDVQLDVSLVLFVTACADRRIEHSPSTSTLNSSDTATSQHALRPTRRSRHVCRWRGTARLV
jgi:hypothetical protein